MSFRMTTSQPWYLVLIGGLLCLGLALPAFQEVQDDENIADSPFLRIDPDKIVQAEKDSRVPCGECHVKEYEVWQDTQHARNFDELHRSEQSQMILDRMGFRLAKRVSLCLRCHYTAKIVRDQPRAISGVSCESCHGAARDWLDIHNDYGGATHETETTEHRMQRIQQSIQNGMLRPTDNLYAVAANCFECHTVPQERLINEGGHPSGSDFQLIDWSNQIRHNFLEAQWSTNEENREFSQERKRMMYVVGNILNYEYSMRGVAAATKPGIYAKAMERRTKVARRNLDKILRIVEIPELKEILEVGKEAKLVPDNKEDLLVVADNISRIAQEFSLNNDGSALAALDPAVAGEDVGGGDEEPAEDAVVTANDAGSDEGGSPDEGATTPVDQSTPGGNSQPAASSGSAPAASSSPGIQGEVRRRPAWFSNSSHETIGSSGCSCHIDQQNWLSNDTHSRTAERILNESPRSVQIARNYGLSTTQMKLGNRICMSCHGSVVTGDEEYEVFDGVSCESCHGPGGAYASTHPSQKYAGSASKGMVQLENVQARAQNCAKCHYITDERLISSGHPTGAGFNLGQRNQAIKHWQAPTLSPGDLDAAFASIKSSRPVPNVQPAQLTGRPEPPPSGGRSTPTATAGSPVTPAPQPPIVRPVGGIPTSATPASSGGDAPATTGQTGTVPQGTAAGAGVSQRPTDQDTRSTEELLLTIKERLERLYQSTRQGN